MKKVIIKWLMPLMSRLTPACKSVTEKISESLDHKIPFMDRVRVRIHIIGCEFCARYEKQILAMHRMLTDQTDDVIDARSLAKLSNEARQRIKSILHKDKQ